MEHNEVRKLKFYFEHEFRQASESNDTKTRGGRHSPTTVIATTKNEINEMLVFGAFFVLLLFAIFFWLIVTRRG